MEKEWTDRERRNSNNDNYKMTMKVFRFMNFIYFGMSFHVNEFSGAKHGAKNTKKSYTKVFSLRRWESLVAHSREHLKFNSTKETLYVMRYWSLNKSMLHEKICRNVFWSEKCLNSPSVVWDGKGFRCWLWKMKKFCSYFFFHSSTWDRKKAAINVYNRDC